MNTKEELTLSEKGKEIYLSEKLQATNNFKDYPETSIPPKVIVAPMGTGPFVLNNLPSLIEQLRTTGGKRKVTAIDMEAVAIFKVKGIDCPKIVIKSVSDFGNAEKDDSFHNYASHTSAAFLLYTIINYFRK
jgi:nucleoside phosphorylase